MTFVVFRGQPDMDWPRGNNVQARPVELDSDRLAPTDNVTDAVDVFIGIHASEMPVLARHPLIAVIEAARHKLILLEVEMPVPSPDGEYRDRQWTRARVAIRDAGDLQAHRIPGRYPQADKRFRANRPCDCRPDCADIGSADPRRHGTDVQRSELEPVLTGDLDVSNVRALAHEPRDSVTWRMIVMCAKARSNIESDLIRHLVRHLQNRCRTACTASSWRT